MSKKTLNESTIRRFMGLANIQPTVVSNYISENYNEEKEELEELSLKKNPPEGVQGEKGAGTGGHHGKLNISRDKAKADAFNKGTVDVADDEMEEADDPALDAAPPDEMDAEMPPEPEPLVHGYPRGVASGPV